MRPFVVLFVLIALFLTEQSMANSYDRKEKLYSEPSEREYDIHVHKHYHRQGLTERQLERVLERQRIRYEIRKLTDHGFKD